MIQETQWLYINESFVLFKIHNYIIQCFLIFLFLFKHLKLYQFVLFIKSGLRGWGCLHRHAYISQSKWLHLEGILWMIWTFVLKCWHLLLTLFGMVCALTLSPLHLVDIGDCLNRPAAICKLCPIWWLHTAIYSQYMYTYAFC